jgi:hypothetical protein
VGLFLLFILSDILKVNKESPTKAFFEPLWILEKCALAYPLFFSLSFFHLLFLFFFIYFLTSPLGALISLHDLIPRRPRDQYHSMYEDPDDWTLLVRVIRGTPVRMRTGVRFFGMSSLMTSLIYFLAVLHRLLHLLTYWVER